MNGLSDGLGSFVAVYLVAAFLPGILANFLVVQLTVFKQRSVFFFSVNSLLLGLIAYTLYGLAQWLVSLVTDWPGHAPDLAVIQVLNGNAPTLDFAEIAVTTGLAVAVGCIASVAVNRKWLHRLARRAKLTKNLGDLNIWSHAFNSGVERSQDTTWVRVRNATTNLYYDGWVQHFSDHSGSDELLLRDVWLLDNRTGERIYKVPAVYLKLDSGEWTVEFPMAAETELMKRFDLPEPGGNQNDEPPTNEIARPTRKRN